QILAYTIALSLVSVSPYLIGMSHLPYLWAALALNAGFLYWALALAHGREDAPLKTFHYSIVYLGLLFLALLIDHYLSSFFG
ncbi:MAG: protoheme IX farnesyltransferase, partial [Candidatus Tectomicrobia bacterium]